MDGICQEDSFKKLKLDMSIFGSVLRIGLPAGIQTIIITFSNVAKTVLQAERVDPKTVTHIGDNLKSDVIRPRLIGMKGVLVSAS